MSDMDKRKPVKQAVMKADIAAVDRGEKLQLMEPLLLSGDSGYRTKLADLSLELASSSAALKASLQPGVRSALADLVRTMNCYYSNLIEDHDTHPVDIERAMSNDYSTDKKKRNLQLEAKAHVIVQTWIDSGALSGRSMTKEAVLEVHRRFCDNLPPDLLVVHDPDSKEPVPVIPGHVRTRDVKVGQHYAVSPGAVPRFLERFEAAYSGLGKSESILASAAAHHRLLWIHPFIDGNGRVARLVSYAQLLDALDSGGIWSVARGLARNVSDYKGHLMACDQDRLSDVDGRGQLSEESLGLFTDFFLRTCLDQIRFMESLVQPSKLRERILLWAQEETQLGNLGANAKIILEAALFRGDLPRADIPGLVGLQERQTRRLVADLAKRGVLTSASDRAPVRLSFPASLASRWMPGLFPDAPA